MTRFQKSGANAVAWLIFGVPPLLLLVLVFYKDWEAVLRIRCWFDPILLQYNTLMAVAAILVSPLIAFIYTRSMRSEKERRLRRAIDAADWPSYEQIIKDRLENTFHFTNYIGSVTTAMVVTAFGVGVLLLMKLIPLDLEVVNSTVVAVDSCSGRAGQGLDFSKGASFLMLATFMKDIGSPKDFYLILIVSLTAFQFGFLGAWVHFIGQLTRSYFTCDLTPDTFIDGSVRMVIASLLALVVSFILPTAFDDGIKSDAFQRALPVLGFFFGYFPNRALLVIENFADKSLAALLPGKSTYQSTPLSTLPGVSYQHEIRLQREGIDNVENLSKASAIDFALRTGFGFTQLEQWIGQAWLRTHLGEDYQAFEKATGITSRQELKAFLEGWKATPPHERPQDQLKESLDALLHTKVEVMCVNA